MALTWEHSGRGQGSCPVTLQDVQLLCVDAGFKFRGADDEGLPLARRADLQALFEHFGVNSLSAFRQKFWARELRPGGPGSGDGQPIPTTPASCSRWQVQQQGKEMYVGETLNGMRHGGGILLSKGKQSLVVHIGRFVDGQRSGPGVVTSSRGERFEGYFHEDVMWGPGEYRYALPVVASGSDGYSSSGSTGHAAEAPEAAGGGDGGSATAGAEPSTGAAGPPPAPPPQPHRVCYRGMLNGKPQGKGCMEWSNGRQQAGQFDGNNMYMRLEHDAVAGVLMVAADNASDARAAATEVQAAAARQAPEVAEEAARQCAAMARQPADGQMAEC